MRINKRRLDKSADFYKEKVKKNEEENKKK